MSIVNHGAVGALIAIVIKQPALALPIAFLSHFIMDALPHFGFNGNGFGEALKNKKLVILHQSFNVPAFMALMLILYPFGWIAYVGAAVAVSPDLAWPTRYWFYERHGKAPRPNGPIIRFHHNIQWCERPWGFVIEMPLTIALLGILFLMQP